VNDNVLREVRDLVAGSSSISEVTRPSDPAIRHLVAEQLLAAMSGPDAEEQERAREIFIRHGYLDETTNRFRCADSAADRAAAANTLGIVGSRLATAHLIAGIFDREPEVCRAAAEALARIKDPAVSMGPLNFLLKTQSDQTATDVTQTVSLRGESTEPEFVETERSVEDPAFALGADAADVPAEIVAGLTSILPEQRVEALARLTHSDAKTKVKLIVNYFADVSPDVRNAAARALYELDPDHSAEPFGRAIEEGSSEQGRNIGAALAASGVAGKAIEDLAGESREDAYNSLCLLFAMARTGEIQPLIKAIEGHPSGEVRRAAVRLLTLNGQSEVAAEAAKRRLMAPVK
jgi:HEAT repeat protein